jgi:hypothetical protein
VCTSEGINPLTNSTKMNAPTTYTEISLEAAEVIFGGQLPEYLCKENNYGTPAFHYTAFKEIVEADVARIAAAKAAKLAARAARAAAPARTFRLVSIGD